MTVTLWWKLLRILWISTSWLTKLCSLLIRLSYVVVIYAVCTATLIEYSTFISPSSYASSSWCLNQSDNRYQKLYIAGHSVSLLLYPCMLSLWVCGFLFIDTNFQQWSSWRFQFFYQFVREHHWYECSLPDCVTAIKLQIKVHLCHS